MVRRTVFFQLVDHGTCCVEVPWVTGYFGCSWEHGVHFLEKPGQQVHCEKERCGVASSFGCVAAEFDRNDRITERLWCDIKLAGKPKILFSEAHQRMGVFPLLKSLLPVVVAFLLPTTDTLDHRRVGNGTHRHGLFQEPMEELPAMA